MRLLFRSSNLFLDLLVLSMMSWFIYTCPKCFTISESSRDVSQIIKALRRSLIYVKDERGTKTLDVALGIALTKGNLRWISTVGIRSEYYREIQQLSNLCDYVFHLLYSVLHKSASEKERKFSSLLMYQFDEIIAEDLKMGALLMDTNIKFPTLNNCSAIASYVLTGSPYDSDTCILELLSKTCNVSDSCWFEETNDLEYFGYKTSHRLLYLQLATRCTDTDPRRSEVIQAMKSSLCVKMLSEADFLEKNYLPFTRDLLLEQIALCGFEGYLEFFRSGWTKKILQWQRREGCFGLLPLEIELEEGCSDAFHRLKRSDTLLNGVCHTHITAVSFSALAFHLRATLFASEINPEQSH